MAQKKDESEKKSNWIVKNLVGAALFVVLLGVGAQGALSLITRHGKVVKAPDFTNLTVAQAQDLAEQSQVRIKVTDSVFVRRLPGGIVYRQQPKAGATVKMGRSIFLTINSIVPRKVVMPNLYGYSITEARAELKNHGLNLGKLSYVKDIATNTVLEQYCEGKAVKAGDLVVSGSSIDLKVGVAQDDNKTVVPRVEGIKLVSALDILHDHFLNAGRLRFDPGVRSYTDSLNAVVYKQDIAPGEEKPLGTAISLSLTLDPAKIPAAQ